MCSSDLGQKTGFLNRALETAQGDFKRFVFFETDGGHGCLRLLNGRYLRGSGLEKVNKIASALVVGKRKKVSYYTCSPALFQSTFSRSFRAADW